MFLQPGYYLHNNKYQLLSILGEGGFSLTYRGMWKTEVHGVLGKLSAGIPVCIKEFFFKDYCRRNPQTFFVETNSENAKEIFNKNKENVIREARILSEIHHPNVVNVLEVFKQNNTVYIVMEFIAGHSLKQEVEQNGVFTEEKLRPVIYKIGQALEYIHEKNILHLDIKPSNILITKNSNPKLIDFGISKRYSLQNDQETSATFQAASKGYASIEQYDSEAMQVFSPCPDIYSLGATMYFLLTGQIPTESILRSSKGLQSPRELNPAISENTEKVILKAMELNASDRYETVTDMLLAWGFVPEKDRINLSAMPASEDNSDLIKKINEPLYDADADDATVINSLSADRERKKKRKRRLAALAAVLPVCIATVFYIAGNNTGVKNRPATGTVSGTEEPVPPASTVQSVPEPVPPAPEETPEEPPIDPQQEKYNKSFDNAIQAFNARDYEQAAKFIEEAELQMITNDTKKYKQLCQNELEKIEIQKRKNLYDFFVEFGNFAVVKKKTSGLYGTIDDKGFEIVKCIYVSTQPSGNNRLFQRSDDLYDLYDTAGKLLAEGVTGFE
ncbi:MAG: serine/threonine protein kinase [Dysgonamonadaceae bacterium]|jgi:serine/threonine-protein kinase|nr:serine/threonine protein kinase [Dysgonamonadaceae bacterium]